jgi:hypothetical protein
MTHDTETASATLLKSQALAGFFFVLHKNVLEEFKKTGVAFPIAMFYKLEDADAYANEHELCDDLCVVDLHGVSIHTEVCENCGAPCTMRNEYHLYDDAMSNDCEVHFFCNRDDCQHCVQDYYRVCAEGHCGYRHPAYEGKMEREILIDKAGKNFPDPNEQKCSRCIADDALTDKKLPRVLIVVDAGVAYYQSDEGLRVEIVDMDECDKAPDGFEDLLRRYQEGE